MHRHTYITLCTTVLQEIVDISYIYGKYIVYLLYINIVYIIYISRISYDLKIIHVFLIKKILVCECAGQYYLIST